MKAILFYAFGISLFLATVSCADDDNAFPATSPSEISSTITNGNWRVASFTENGTDVAPGFSSYSFTFSTANTVVATNASNSISGTWNVTSESEGDDDNNTSHDVDFIMLFNNQPFFEKLNHDWDVLERTSTKLRLKHVSGGNGGTDYVTFEKN